MSKRFSNIITARLGATPLQLLDIYTRRAGFHASLHLLLLLSP
jgi:hypothetical protein